MSDLPKDMPAELIAALFRQCHPAYLRVDEEGRVMSWGGDLPRYGVATPIAGKSAAECLAALEGQWTAGEPQAVIPCVQVGSGCVADVHTLSDDGAWWVVLVDASAEAARRQQLHQLNNELALLRRRDDGGTANDVDQATVVELLPALDVLVIGYVEDAAAIIGRPPLWFAAFFSPDGAQPTGADIWERFPFLNNFLVDARMHWAMGNPGAIKSGIWFEIDAQANECALEATALSVGHRRVLLVELLSNVYQERRQLIQKAREGQLHSDELRKVGERLAVQAEELNRSNSELRQFASAASHDLRAPLRAVHSLTSWLEVDLGDAITDEVRDILRLLKDRVGRMDHMITGLLDYAKADFFTAEIAEVDIVELVNELWYMLAPPEHFALEVPVGARVVHIAREPLAQVLRNLMGNAIQHHDRQQGRIVVDIAEGDDSYEFTVADDGPGIPAHYQDRLFQMFQTLPPATRSSGSGMGLALAKKIVTQHGGKVSLDDTTGRGATFRVRWPKP